jgi:signal transduction histidine kinase
MTKKDSSKLFGRIGQAVSRLTYYGAYVDAMKRLEIKSDFEELGLLAASLAHDLSNPLVAMDSRIAEMRRQSGGDARIEGFLDELDRQLSRLQYSVEMVPLLRGRAEHFGQLMRKVSAGDLLHKAIKDLKREFRVADSIFFRVDDRRFFLRADPRMLERAILCVLKNSVEAIQETKRPGGLISINLTKSDEMVHIEIEDDGCGIPEENISRIVESSKNYGSANRGLGLFMTTRILDQHNGKLSISSERGKGTTVLLILPGWKDEVSNHEQGGLKDARSDK